MTMVNGKTTPKPTMPPNDYTLCDKIVEQISFSCDDEEIQYIIEQLKIVLGVD